MPSEPRGHVTIDGTECKGCGLCVESCAPGVLSLSPALNENGVHAAVYAGSGCSGCGVCFYCCPEPGAITVYKVSADGKGNGAPKREDLREELREGRGDAAPVQR